MISSHNAESDSLTRSKNLFENLKDRRDRADDMLDQHWNAHLVSSDRASTKSV